MKAPLIYLFFLLFTFNFSAEDFNHEEQRMLSTLYVQTAAEHRASVLQTFKTATNLLPEAIEDASWNALPNLASSNRDLAPAIIIDVDDTVLDNSPYEARLIKSGQSYPSGWGDWCNESQAKPLPGVLEFLLKAEQMGVKIFYVTNRKYEYEKGTLENFKKFGIPIEGDEDSLLMRYENGWDSNKTSRRELIAKNHRVIFQIGDNLGDFVDLSLSHQSPEKRVEIVTEFNDMWGKYWFMIENPTYGDWEGALYKFNFDRSNQEIIQIRNKKLDEAR